MDCAQCPTHDGDLFRGSSFERRLVRKLVRDDRGLMNVSEGRKSAIAFHGPPRGW